MRYQILKFWQKKHEIIALIVRDRLEEHPPVMGFSSLMDPENGVTLEGDFNEKSVKNYAVKVHAHDKALYENLRNSGVRFTKIYTDDVASVSLKRVFERR